MAAPAAILILLPGLAMAAVCDTGSLNLANHLPVLDSLLKGQPDGDQFRKFFTLDSLITGAILVWLIAGNSTRSTMTAIAWFLCLAIYHAFAYLSIDLANPYYQTAISEGCVENSPRYILSNLGFAAVAGLLTWQRIRRQKMG
ncbi:hypothetical protein IHQ71_02685 [Rhizobium sp. TH2]|uniref:hypothetical protein n=1 Tax=Rhizobium sp. TH2 TaxID=2775403 RepID=UPI00215875E2|nr:hypothetical protein [Rhizobium sp. TH2]UVC09552.1 hypothetical protein IHQ71_02685 [Rhizobium sp. TH2]